MNRKDLLADYIRESLDKTSDAIASYSMFSTRVTFAYENPDEFNIPYHLDDETFIEKLDEIEKALTWFHEITHYIQSWSTTNGLLEFWALSYQTDQLLSIMRSTKYELPLEHYFIKLIPHALNNNLTENELRFGQLYGGYLAHQGNSNWLTGNVTSNAITDLYFIEGFPKCVQIVKMENGYVPGNKHLGCLNVEPDKKNPKGLTTLAPIGTLHLTECFAKTVEFEHLLHFNIRHAEKIIRAWVADSEALIYNLPFHALNTFAGRVWKNKKTMPYVWAHLRIFIDIAMMYSDFLFEEPRGFFDRKLADRVLNVKVQPGITFLKVLCAFDKCSPLKDHDNDVLRLYDDLCQLLEIPSLSDMINKLLLILESLLDCDFIRSSFSFRYLKVAYELVKEKKRNPRLFVNDLIYPDQFSSLHNSLLSGRIAIVTPNSYSERTDFETIYFDIVYEICKDAVSNNKFKCTKTILTNRFFNKKDIVTLCRGDNPHIGKCKNCGPGKIIGEWLRNKLEE